jgi:serine/threonine-protein kinase/serine/threonine-protein kinase PknK
LDFDDALRWQRWGRQFHDRISGTLSVSYGYCFAGIAANEQLDIAGAEAHLRHAMRIALLPSGRPTYIAKLAGALLGELFYEHGQLDEAELLLDDAYALGAEGGIVDFMLASFGTGAMLKFARGDAAAAHRRLAEGLDIAKTLQLPRLQARLVNVSARIAALSGMPIGDSLALRITHSQSERPDELDGVTAELIEGTQIRVLLQAGTPEALDEACARARACRDRIDQHDRPRAHLGATLQFAHCLGVAGDHDEAVHVLYPALRTCAALGLSQLLLDEGPQMIRLAQDAIHASGSRSPDQVTQENIRDFVSNLSDASSV